MACSQSILCTRDNPCASLTGLQKVRRAASPLTAEVSRDYIVLSFILCWFPPTDEQDFIGWAWAQGCLTRLVFWKMKEDNPKEYAPRSTASDTVAASLEAYICIHPAKATRAQTLSPTDSFGPLCLTWGHNFSMPSCGLGQPFRSVMFSYGVLATWYQKSGLLHVSEAFRWLPRSQIFNSHSSSC